MQISSLFERSQPTPTTIHWFYIAHYSEVDRKGLPLSNVVTIETASIDTSSSMMNGLQIERFPIPHPLSLSTIECLPIHWVSEECESDPSFPFQYSNGGTLSKRCLTIHTGGPNNREGTLIGIVFLGESRNPFFSLQ